MRRAVFVLGLAVLLTPSVQAAQAGGSGASAVRPYRDDMSVARMPLSEFKKLHAEGKLLVVDVRTEDAYAHGHIPDAVLLPLGDVERSVDRLREQAAGRTIVTYCT